jgi:CIC family chloride channel protein
MPKRAEVHRTTLTNAFRFFTIVIVSSCLVGLVISAFAWLLTIVERAVSRLMMLPHNDSLSLAPKYELHHAWIAFIPALGGLLVGIFMHFFPAAKGYGVPEVIARLEARDTKIRAHLSLFTFITSVITIGSNGSAGPEGPSAAIGAAVASGITHKLSLSKEQRRILVACGAAAGLAALFNATLVGAFFAMEVLLKDINPKKFALIATAAITGKLVAVHGAVAGHTFSTASLPALTHISIVLAFGLGIISAPLAIAFMYTFRTVPKAFKKLPVPLWVKPAIGGLIVGIIGLLVPQILGEGQNVIQQLLLVSSSSVFTLLLIALLKPLTTSITIGSGGVGGVFLPSIFIGAAVGATYGTLFHHLIGSTVSPELFAAIGMGTIIAGAINAPLTAIMIVLQLTGAFQILPALVAAIAASTLLARYIQPESIYSLALRARESPAKPKRMTSRLKI